MCIPAMPRRKIVKYDGCVESYYYAVIEHQFIIVLNANFVNCVLNGGLSNVQTQFSWNNFRLQRARLNLNVMTL